MIRRSFLILVVLAMFATALATQYPLTITDALGRSVTLDARPLRIVSMIPSHTETVCAIGACDRLVGVDEHSDWPAQVLDLPHLGNAYSPNLEAIVALAPDLVLTDASTDLAATLERLGIPSYAAMAKGYDDVFDEFAAIGRLLDEETAATALIGRVRDAVDRVATATAGFDRPRVFVELDATPYAAGPESYIGVLVSKAGGDNLLDASMGQYPLVDPEAIVAGDPQVIVLLDAPFGESASSVAERPGWGALSAVEHGRVIAPTQVQVDMLSRPGPRLADAVALLASWFHPGAF